MSDKAKAMERLIQSVVTGEKLRTATNAELADLMREHVWAGLMMCSAVADLVSEVMDRLRGLKTCASCHGWGYVEHARCIPCGGTGDVAPSADAATSLDALALQADEFARVTFPARSAESISEHLRREAVELAAAPTDAEEMADVFILLGNLVHFTGTNLNAAVVAKLAKNRARKWGKPDAHGVVEHVREAPPADAATEDAVTAWARLAVALLSRHESAWDHDPGPDDDGCDEDCRACEYVALLRTGRSALSTPAPAPSAKEDTIEHPCGCYAPDGDVCWKHAAPTAPATRRGEQPGPVAETGSGDGR